MLIPLKSDSSPLINESAAELVSYANDFPSRADNSVIAFAVFEIKT